jgi:hypothetical protein
MSSLTNVEAMVKRAVIALLLPLFLRFHRKLNVLKVTSTQIWKITSMWKISFFEHLSSPHWPMYKPNFIPKSKSYTNA